MNSVFIVFRKPSPMAMVSQEGNSKTPCLLTSSFSLLLKRQGRSLHSPADKPMMDNKK